MSVLCVDNPIALEDGGLEEVLRAHGVPEPAVGLLVAAGRQFHELVDPVFQAKPEAVRSLLGSLAKTERALHALALLSLGYQMARPALVNPDLQRRLKVARSETQLRLKELLGEGVALDFADGLGAHDDTRALIMSHVDSLSYRREMIEAEVLHILATQAVVRGLKEFPERHLSHLPVLCEVMREAAITVTDEVMTALGLKTEPSFVITVDDLTEDETEAPPTPEWLQNLAEG